MLPALIPIIILLACVLWWFATYGGAQDRRIREIMRHQRALAEMGWAYGDVIELPDAARKPGGTRLHRGSAGHAKGHVWGHDGTGL